MLTRRLAAAGILLLLAGASAAQAQVTLERGGLWQFDVHAALRACLGGSCASSRASDSAQFDVPIGTLVNVGILIGGCAATVDPGEMSQVSEYRPAKHGGHTLKVTDRKGLRSLLAGCTGYSAFHLTGMSGGLKEAPDGSSFDTTIRATFTLRIEGHTVSATLVTKVHGGLIEEGLALAPAPAGTRLLTDPIAAVAKRLGLPAE